MLSVATWNLRNFFEASDPRGYGPGTAASSTRAGHMARRIAHVADMLSQCDADIMLLQEVGSDAILRVVVEKMGGSFPLVLFATPDERGIGNAIVSRLAAVDVRELSLPRLVYPVVEEGQVDTIGPSLALRRAAVCATFSVPTLGRVTTIGGHLKSLRARGLRRTDGTHAPIQTAHDLAESVVRAATIRAAEALALRNHVSDQLARDPLSHVLLAGDMNDSVSSTTLRTLLLSGSPWELFDTSAAAKGPTDTILHDGRGQRIDHILVTRGLRDRLVSHHVLAESLRDLGRGEAVAIESDHAPVVARFR